MSHAKRVQKLYEKMAALTARELEKLGLEFPGSPEATRAKYPGKRTVIEYHYRDPRHIGSVVVRLVDENDPKEPPAGSVTHGTIIEESE